MIHFCSYFDKNYLSRFLALLESLNAFNFKYTFFVLALDDFVVTFFEENNFKCVKVIRLDELENKYKNLSVAKNNRDLIEYYFTLSPFLVKYISEELKISQISYLDADFYFFKDPKTTIERNIDFSIVLIKQNSNPKYGLYNVGWIYYNFDFHETLEIVDIWSEQCLNFCSDFPTSSSYADQKYLDTWPQKLKNIKIMRPESTCLSPWDINLLIETSVTSMLAFHFHGLELHSDYFATGFGKYNKRISKKIFLEIYIPYIKKLLFIEKKYYLKSSSIRDLSKNKYKKLLLKVRKIKSFIKAKYYKDSYSYKLLEN